MKLWNVGIKVDEVDAEVAFFERLGAKVLLREERSAAAQGSAYAFLEFGGTRLFVTARPLFEEALAEPLQNGLTHIVLESDTLDEAITTAAACGASPLLTRRTISAAFGVREILREISFFRSPGGVIFELMAIREEKL